MKMLESYLYNSNNNKRLAVFTNAYIWSKINSGNRVFSCNADTASKPRRELRD